MTIYHIEFAKTGSNLSGGEVWMIEVIKYLQSKKVRNILLTTDNGKTAYEKSGLHESEYLKYKIIDSYAHEKRLPIFISYIIRTIQAKRLVSSLSIKNTDKILCHSDFFPNTIPFNKLVSEKFTTHVFCMFHMLAPSLFRGYEGHFLGKRQVTKPNIYHYRINQWLYYRIIRRTKATVITNNGYYADLIKSKCANNTVYTMRHFAGAEKHNSVVKKAYDIIWIGRFHPQKGLLEIPGVIKRIRKQIPNLRVLIVGDGEKKLKSNLMMSIVEQSLTNTVEIKGFITGDEKYDLLCKSKVFLMTSFYESFGIVNLEAMKNAIPVVAYDLPVYSTFEKGMVKVPLANKNRMAEEVVRLLKDPSYYSKTSKDAEKFAMDFSWERTGDEIYTLLNTKGSA